VDGVAANLAGEIDGSHLYCAGVLGAPEDGGIHAGGVWGPTSMPARVNNHVFSTPAIRISSGMAPIGLWLVPVGARAGSARVVAGRSFGQPRVVSGNFLYPTTTAAASPVSSQGTEPMDFSWSRDRTAPRPRDGVRPEAPFMSGRLTSAGASRWQLAQNWSGKHVSALARAPEWRAVSRWRCRAATCMPGGRLRARVSPGHQRCPCGDGSSLELLGGRVDGSGHRAGGGQACNVYGGGLRFTPAAAAPPPYNCPPAGFPV